MDYEEIGENIRLLRARVGISQESLAEATQVSRQHMGAIERGQKIASLETIVQIANVLGVPVGEILGTNIELMEDEKLLTDCSMEERSILVENMADLKKILRKHSKKPL